MLIKSAFLKAVKAAAFASAVFGLILGCSGGGGNNPAGPDPGPTTDSELVGDWLVYDGVNKKGYITLNANGKLSEGVLRKVGNFWIEGLYEGKATWGVSRGRGELYVISAAWRDTMQYVLSGNTITTTSYYENSGQNRISRRSELKRIDIDVFKNSIGAVYANDTNLYMSTSHSDLMWSLQGNANETIDFDAVYVNKDSDRYGIGVFRDGMWYTSGSTLVLLEVAYDCGYKEDDCGAAVLNKVELNYSVTTGVGGAPTRLTLSRAGSSVDVWLPASFDDRMGYASAKSRQGASAAKRAFSPLAVLTGRE